LILFPIILTLIILINQLLKSLKPLLG